MTMTSKQGNALATLIHELRSDWGIPGIVAELRKAADRGTPFDVALAAIHAAQDEKNRTPAVIALPGPHWTKGKALGEATPIHYARCPVIGHTSYAASNCGLCANDALDPTPTPQTRVGLDRERVRQILANHGTTDGRNER